MRHLSVLVALLLFGAGAAMAQHGPGPGAPEMPSHPPMMMGHGPMCMMDDDDDHGGPMMGCLMGVDLTDDQETALDKMRLEHQRKHVERQAQMVELKTRLKLALTADKFSPKDVDDIAVKIGKFHQESIQLRAAHMRQVRDILTPEQRVMFDQNILSMGMGGKGGMDKGFKMMKHRCGGRGPGWEEHDSD